MAWLRPSVWRSRSWPRSPEPEENHAVLKVGAEPRQLVLSCHSCHVSSCSGPAVTLGAGRLARPRSRPGNQSMWGGHWQWTDNGNHVGTHESRPGKWACHLSIVIFMFLKKTINLVIMINDLSPSYDVILELIVLEVGFRVKTQAWE